MWWIILFIPVCIWLSTGLLGAMNGLTLGIVGLTVAIFFYVEYRQVRKDRSRSMTPLWIMALMLVSIGAGVFF